MKSSEPTPPEGFPRATDEIDVKLQKNLQQAHRVRWMLVGAVICFLVAAIVFLSFTLADQQRELKASCLIWGSLTTLPVTVNPQTGQATRLSVTIIAGAREAFDGQKCGEMSAADPTTIKWAHIYHIRLP